MPRSPAAENTGTLLRTPSGYFAQFSIGGGRRKGALLRTCKTEEEAERRQLAVAKLVARLRETGYASMVPNVIRDAGAVDDEGMRTLARLVERIATGKEPGLARRHAARREGTTVKELAQAWTSGDLAKQYPDHVRVKKAKQTTNDVRIFEWFGKVRMPDGGTFGERVVAEIRRQRRPHHPTTSEEAHEWRRSCQRTRRVSHLLDRALDHRVASRGP